MSVKSFWKRSIKNFLWRIIFWNKKIYYENHYNSLNFFHLIIFNIIWPGRTITRLRYGRLNIESKKKNIKEIDFDKKKNELYRFATNELFENGAVVLDQYFDVNRLESFEEKYKKYFNLNDLLDGAKSSWKSEVLPLSKILMEFWTDELILKIIEGYIGRLPIARNYTQIQYFNPQFEKGKLIEDRAFASEWHMDHSTLIQFAIYFTDVHEEGSCMQVLKGSHKYLSVANTYLSNEYVDSHRLSKKNCFGKRGSVQIHCGNVFHRLRAKDNSPRAWLKFELCSGNNILFDLNKAFFTMSGDLKLDDLTEKQRSFFKGLYPLSPFKGYELEGDYITPTKFKGV